MSLNYTSLQNSLANLMVVGVTDPNFLTDFPNIIDYAEQRIYRELDLLATRKIDNGVLTPQQRTFTLPTNIGKFLVVEEICVIAPSDTSRTQLVPVTKQFIDVVYPSATLNTGTPEFYAVLDDLTVLLGPSPDQAYTAEVQGTQRPTPLSISNTTTWLTQYVPDLFLAACMVRATGYQKNWGAQADDPKMAVSWENQYQMLKASAQVEEFRKMARSQAWTTEAPSPIATPART